MTMAFDLPNLPYAYDALETSGMSKETLEFHHDLHHKAYVDNGNKLIAGTQWEDKSLEEIITGTYDAGAIAQNGVFNNASQHWNHVQFWEMMGPTGRAMPSELESALTEQFGSVDAFKEAFTAAGIGQFGSGWCWLVQKADGELSVTKTENGVIRFVLVKMRCLAVMYGSIPTTLISAISGQFILLTSLITLLTGKMLHHA